MGKNIDYLDTPDEARMWNVAKGYSETKILKHLIDLDEYENVALYGVVELPDEYIVEEDIKNRSRIKALKRLMTTLLMIIGNTKFVMKKKRLNTELKQLEAYQKSLKNLLKLVSVTYSETIDEVKGIKILKIYEDKFQKLLEVVLVIKEEINSPIDKANLIYMGSEIVDPFEERKRKIRELEYLG